MNYDFQFQAATLKFLALNSERISVYHSRSKQAIFSYDIKDFLRFSITAENPAIQLEFRNAPCCTFTPLQNNVKELSSTLCSILENEIVRTQFEVMELGRFFLLQR